VFAEVVDEAVDTIMNIHVVR